MSRPDVILSFTRYEIKRAIARRKVLALIAFTVLLDTLPYYALSTAGTTLIPGSAYPYIWVAGVFAVQPLFLNFTAILIAAGAMSEEYEQGTAELLLSKPVERNDYFAGKFLGGYTLFLTILAFNTVLSVASAFTFFGTQFGLEILPGLFLVQAFAALIFYSLAFMLGELVRRSSLANSLPIQYASPLLPQTVGIVLQFVGSGNAIVPTLDLSVAILLVYTIPAIAVAAAYFWFADISRKMS